MEQQQRGMIPKMRMMTIDRLYSADEAGDWEDFREQARVLKKLRELEK